MRKCQTGLVLLCCGALFLTGCSRQEQELARRELLSAKAENDALRKQVKVLQDNVKILQNELAARAASSAEAAAVPAIAPVTAPVTRLAKAPATSPGTAPVTATKTTPSAQLASKDFTRDEFKNKVLGMRPEELTQFAGPPDNRLPSDNTERWVYDRLPCRKSDGTVEYVTTHILVENGRAIRVLFVDNVQYGP